MTKLASLKSECEGIGCSVTSEKKYTAGLKKILTEEQLSKCKTECEKKDAECPIAKVAKKN